MGLGYFVISELKNFKKISCRLQRTKQKTTHFRCSYIIIIISFIRLQNYREKF